MGTAIKVPDYRTRTAHRVVEAQRVEHLNGHLREVIAHLRRIQQGSADRQTWNSDDINRPGARLNLHAAIEEIGSARKSIARGRSYDAVCHLRVASNALAQTIQYWHWWDSRDEWHQIKELRASIAIMTGLYPRG